MKKIILILLLLASFSIAEETNHSAQESPQEAPIKPQDLGGGYTKDTTNVFFNGRKIEDADPETFKRILGYHARDKNYIFFAEYKIDSVDYTTFEVVEMFPNHYARDKNYIFFWGQKVEGVNPETFEPIYNLYIRDKNHIYSLGNFLMGRQYIVDTPQSLNISDLISLRASDGTMSRYSKSAGKIYYFIVKYEWFNEIKGADVETFEVLDSHYAKDKNFVYFDGKLISVHDKK